MAVDISVTGDHVSKMFHNEFAELADIGHYNFEARLSYYGFDINRLIDVTNRQSKRLELSFRKNCLHVL